MNDQLMVANLLAGKRISTSAVILLAVAFLISSALRISLVVLYPVVVIFLGLIFKFKITTKFKQLLIVICLSVALSFLNGAYIKYKLLSLFYMVPLLFLLFTNFTGSKKNDYLKTFMQCLTIVALLNDVIGIIQLLVYPSSDDNFIGLYSHFSISINGLSLLNAVLFFYYFARMLAHKKKIYLSASIFFLVTSVLGFYGAGLAVTIAAFTLTFLRLRMSSMLKVGLISFVTFSAIYFLLYILKPKTLEYNIANIKKLASFNTETSARKSIAFHNYIQAYPQNPKDFLFGSGPGTFNSRSAFMVGSPSYFSKFDFIKDYNQPYYFKYFAYPLWNESNTSQALYLDGFRNQPFSSILAFLGEYGLLFTLLFFYFLYGNYKKTSLLYKRNRYVKNAKTYMLFYKFLTIFLILLLLIDNYFEYPEIMILTILAAKFAQSDLANTQKSTLHEE